MTNVTSQEIIQKVETELHDIDSFPFSNAAFALLKKKIGEYIDHLVSESINVSKRRNLDTISASHVEAASEYLVCNTSKRFFGHLGTIGGILLGASLSNILAMMTVQQYPIYGILISIVLSVIGTFMIAMHMAKD